MAISKIKKIEIIGLDKDRDGLLGLLQKLGQVQLINIQQPEVTTAQQAAQANMGLTEIEEAVSLKPAAAQCGTRGSGCYETILLTSLSRINRWRGSLGEEMKSKCW